MKNEYQFHGFSIPGYMFEGIERWVQQGIYPGSFLLAVLENDLTNVVFYADDRNLCNIPAYVGYFYNEAPSGCWGSRKKVQEWHDHKGLSGLKKMRSIHKITKG